MLTMSRSCTVVGASDQGGGGVVGAWKDSYHHQPQQHRPPTIESVGSLESYSEDSVDSDNSSSTSSSNHPNQSRSGSNLQTVGCITTHSVSTVIRPEKKMPPIDPLQFVKVQKNELCQKAIEQIKLAEDTKISKEKIKENEEEWQNNLLSWKSKRKLTKNNSEDEAALSGNPNRKTKTFKEIIAEKARSGGRISSTLLQFVPQEEEDGEEEDFSVPKAEYIQQQQSQGGNYYEESQPEGEQEENDNLSMAAAYERAYAASSYDTTESNLNRLLNSHANGQIDENGENEEPMYRNGLGEVVVFNTTLLEEYSFNNNAPNKSDSGCDMPLNQKQNSAEIIEPANFESEKTVQQQSLQSSIPHKVHVPINDWKSSHQKSSPHQRQQQHPEEAEHAAVAGHLIPQQNSSFDVEDEEEEVLDEELERLRLDQERSFKAKLSAFENLAKQEEEAARRAAESSRLRQQSRQQKKLAAERSKSLGNIQQQSQMQQKHHQPVQPTFSLSGSAISGHHQNSSEPNLLKPREEQSKSLQNLNSDYPLASVSGGNSTVYNFTDKRPAVNPEAVPELKQQQQQTSAAPQYKPVLQTKQQQQQPLQNQQQSQAQNIYENIAPLSGLMAVDPSSSSLDPVTDSNAIRNASQKLLQQQQQIYQNQPLPVQYQQQQPQYPPVVNYHPGYQQQQQYPPHHPHLIQPTDNIINADKVINPVPLRYNNEIGLPPIQITKSNQSGSSVANTNGSKPLLNSGKMLAGKPLVEQEEHLYMNQNQLMMNQAPPNTQVPPHLYAYQQPQLPTYDSYHNSNHHYPLSAEPNYENKALIQKRIQEESAIYPPAGAAGEYSQQYAQPPPHNPHYLFYPKPYSAVSSPSPLKPIQSQQRVVAPINPPQQQQQRQFVSNGAVSYNPNHWLLQEAELRRELDSRDRTKQQQQNASNGIQSAVPQQSNAPSKSSSTGFLSVSGKKKCSSCQEELGKGCAAMVVESLSLYYHINCFRCSVCNVQLGNGTVGTDVRVRNNKLHCQNCYSNDEAGLKFSRV